MKATKKATRKPRGTEIVKREETGLPIKVAPVKLDEPTLAKIVLRGDLSDLTPTQLVDYYAQFCRHVGLNPVTKPFDVLNLSGKKVLYANRTASDQLRKINGVSITKLDIHETAESYTVVTYGSDRTGRSDSATAVVWIKGATGEAFCNLKMKCETKSKRRLTLSLCGLGMLDETEVETIPGAQTEVVIIGDPQVYNLNPSTVERAPMEPMGTEQRAAADDEWIAVGKVPQFYWAKKGNRDAQQLSLIEAYGSGFYKVEKDTDEQWKAFRKIGSEPQPMSAEDRRIADEAFEKANLT